MINELVEKALEAREKAYAPYSKFKVGTALLTANGKIYTGCNVAKAVADGEKKFIVIAVVGSGENYCMPCGMCRQFMAEFCKEDFEIIVAKGIDDYKIMKIGELLPYTFDLCKG